MSLVRALVVVAGGLVLGSCCEPYSYDVTDTVTVAEDDPQHAAAIADCFEQDFLCERLCVNLIGPPPPSTIRSIVECYVDRVDGSSQLVVHARSHLVTKCLDDTDDTDWGDPYPTYPDAAGPWPDAEVVPDAGMSDAGVPMDADVPKGFQ